MKEGRKEGRKRKEMKGRGGGVNKSSVGREGGWTSGRMGVYWGGGGGVAV